jgi:hypothetical protein
MCSTLEALVDPLGPTLPDDPRLLAAADAALQHLRRP